MVWPTYINMDNSDLDLNVSDLIGTDRNWNIQTFALLFSYDLLNLICTIPLSQGEWTDQLIYGFSKLLHISLSDMKRPSFTNNDPNLQVNSPWIWSLWVPLHVKMFCWRLAWNRLPCKDLLSRCNIIPLNQRYCDVYSNQVEDCEHPIFHCCHTQLFWQQLSCMY